MMVVEHCQCQPLRVFCSVYRAVVLFGRLTDKNRPSFAMSIRRDTLVCLLQQRFASLNLNPGVAAAPRVVEVEIVDALFKYVQKLDRITQFAVEEIDELYSESCIDEDLDAIFENFTIDENEHFDMQYMLEVIEYCNNNPTHGIKTISKRFRRVKRMEYVTRFRQYVEQQGTRREKLIAVAKVCKEKFDEYRANQLTVHDRHIRLWALQKAQEVNLSQTDFKASKWWIAKFKRACGISSRKITKFITFKNERKQEEIENSAVEVILDFVDNVRAQFDPTEVFNTDQSGFNYVVHTNRTLSYTGERVTRASVNAVGPLTHSYTIQPLLNMSGALVGKLYVNLQEIEGQFGPRVATSLPNFPNLFITCSRSGKLTSSLVQNWSQQVLKEVVERLNTDVCVLYVDSWGGHKNPGLYDLGTKKVQLKIFPECTTSLIQPLDLYCFRQWKDIAKRLTEDCQALGIRVDSRSEVLKLQSLIYNQFQHQAFRPMWLCGWRLAGFEVPVVPFQSLAEMLFIFDGECSTSSCKILPFIKCIYCRNILCVKCFFVDYHYH